MDEKTFLAVSQTGHRVCTNMILTLHTMLEIESQGIPNQVTLDKLEFAVDVVAVLRDHLDYEFELTSLTSDD